MAREAERPDALRGPFAGHTVGSSPIEPRRVAVIYHYFSHYRAGIIQELAHESHNRYVLFSDQKDMRNDGIVMYEFPTETQHVALRNAHLGGAWIWQRGLVSVAPSREYDTMVFLGDLHYLSTWVAAWCARYIGRKRVIFWTTGWHRPEYCLMGWVRCRFYHIAHALLLYGQYGWQMAIQKGFDPEACYIVLNSLDWRSQLRFRRTPSTADVNTTRLALGVDPTVPMVTCVSRLTAKRQLGLLFEAAALLKGQGIRISIVLVGGGAEVPIRPGLRHHTWCRGTRIRTDDASWRPTGVLSGK